MIISWYTDVRVLHIVCAALWLGAAAFMTLYLGPAVRTLGPRGMPVTAELGRRHMGAFMGAVGGLTVVSGLLMYWAFTDGFEASIVGHGAGLALGLGGLCGITAAIIGGAILGRSSERVARLAQVASQSTDGHESKTARREIAVLHHRIATFSRIDLALLLAALLLMCLAHAT